MRTGARLTEADEPRTMRRARVGRCGLMDRSRQPKTGRRNERIRRECSAINRPGRRPALGLARRHPRPAALDRRDRPALMRSCSAGGIEARKGLAGCAGWGGQRRSRRGVVVGPSVSAARRCSMDSRRLTICASLSGAGMGVSNGSNPPICAGRQSRVADRRRCPGCCGR